MNNGMMESNDELPEDEEEIIIYVEFQDFVNSNAFNNKNLQLDMIGLDTDHPIMQINGRFYEGSYEDVVGTYMFFEKNNNFTVDDPVFDKAPNLKFFAKTRKLLKMQRVFIKQRAEVLGDSEHNSCIPNMDTIKQAGVPFKYQEEALCFWNKMRDDRMNALNAYLEKQKIREEKKSQGIIPDSESDEDNPFAIYRQKEDLENMKNMENLTQDIDSNNFTPYSNIKSELHKESEVTNVETINSSLQELTVKKSNPEPSTSSDKTQIKSSKPGKDHTIPVKVFKKKKVKMAQNTLKKRKRKEVFIENNSSSTVNNTNEEACIDNVKNIETKDAENISNPVDDAIINNSENNIKSDSTHKTQIDKKLEKLSKREEKMREISVRLKVAVSEYLQTKENQ